jgi:hypothetical protein
MYTDIHFPDFDLSSSRAPTPNEQYLFYWQASMEVEEEKAIGRCG